MKNCPNCGNARIGEEYKCPDCDVFYSQLDEILYAERQKAEQQTIKGRLKIIMAATDWKQSLRNELLQIWKSTPLKTKITLWTIFAFLFALIFAI